MRRPSHTSFLSISTQNHCSVSWDPTTKWPNQQTKEKQKANSAIPHRLEVLHPFPLRRRIPGDTSSNTWIWSQPNCAVEKQEGHGGRKAFLSCIHFLIWVLFSVNAAAVTLPRWKTLPYSLSGWGQAIQTLTQCPTAIKVHATGRKNKRDWRGIRGLREETVRLA